MADVNSVTEFLNRLYPLENRAEWDYPGLIVGRPERSVHSVVLAVDPTYEVIQKALAENCDYLFCHHPLFFRPVHNLSGLNFRGEMVNLLIENQVALYCGHTNADVAPNGVADYFAKKLELLDPQPLVENMGRVGVLKNGPITLKKLAETLTSLVRPTVTGIRVAGDLDAKVSKIAVFPGSADDVFDQVRAANADVYITSDLRHHPVLDLRQQAEFEQRQTHSEIARPFIIEVPHFSAEAVFLEQLLQEFHSFDPSLKVSISPIVTDPWTGRF
jgi:dinuclear metal center YbgI/SA1388 family protein